MCEEKGVSLLCLKYCVVCSKLVSHADDAVTCLNTSCNFRVTVDDCESELHNFAEKDSMSFAMPVAMRWSAKTTLLFAVRVLTR